MGEISLSTLGRMSVTMYLSNNSNGCFCKFSSSVLRNGSTFHCIALKNSNFWSSSTADSLRIARKGGGRRTKLVLVSLFSSSDRISTNMPSNAGSGKLLTIFSAHLMGQQKLRLIVIVIRLVYLSTIDALLAILHHSILFFVWITQLTRSRAEIDRKLSCNDLEAVYCQEYLPCDLPPRNIKRYDQYYVVKES